MRFRTSTAIALTAIVAFAAAAELHAGDCPGGQCPAPRTVAMPRTPAASPAIAALPCAAAPPPPHASFFQTIEPPAVHHAPRSGVPRLLGRARLGRRICR